MKHKKEWLFSLKHTYPMLVSWIPVALAYGLMMRNAGYGFLWSGLFGIICPFGSLQMVAVSFITGMVPWLTVLLTATAMASRHLFYGLSLIGRFREFGKHRFYMIYMLCDELYSLFCSYEIPEDMDSERVHVITALLLQTYWIVLCMLGSLLGALIPFDLTGIDFALTALFLVILVDMLRSAKTSLPAILAGAVGIVCLLIFGPDSFLVPSLLLTVAVLLLLRKYITGKEGEKEA